MVGAGGRAEIASTVGSAPVVVGRVLRNHDTQVAFAEDQHPVCYLGPRGEHESLRKGVRARTLGGIFTAWMPALARTASKEAPAHYVFEDLVAALRVWAEGLLCLKVAVELLIGNRRGFSRGFPGCRRGVRLGGIQGRRMAAVTSWRWPARSRQASAMLGRRGPGAADRGEHRRGGARRYREVVTALMRTTRAGRGGGAARCSSRGPSRGREGER